MQARVITAAELCLKRDYDNIKHLPNEIVVGQMSRLVIDFSITFTSGHYKDQTLDFELRAKESYPFDPPKVICKQHLFHPNVCPTSQTVCMNLLGLDWRPTIGVEGIMMCVMCMFLEDHLHIDLDAPLNREAAELYQQDLTAYINKTREH